MTWDDDFLGDHFSKCLTNFKKWWWMHSYITYNLISGSPKVFDHAAERENNKTEK